MSENMNHNGNSDNDVRLTRSVNDRPKPTSYRSAPRKKSNNGSKIAIVAAVLVLLCGSVAAVAMSGAFGKNEEAPALVQSNPLDISVPSMLIPESEEESSEPEQPVYSPTGTFKADMNKFSASVRADLDENIQSGYVVLYDVTADKILFQKDGTVKCYPASTTKLMTAIVSSQILDKDDVITVGNEIKLINWDSSTAGLAKGMKMTYEMLLDALLLPSGNDAAYTIAVNSAKKYTGDDNLSDEDAVKIFMDLVNDAAKQIGCKKTHYVTPDGWHDDDHYTCAEDLAKIGAFARTIDIVRKSCAKEYADYELLNSKEEQSKEESKNSDGEVSDKYADEDGDGFADNPPTEYDPDWHGTSIGWRNTNALLQTDSSFYSKYADGLKTGFTDEAGSCVVSSATMDGHTLIAVIMRGSLYSKYEDANKLFTEGFKLYGLKYKWGQE